MLRDGDREKQEHNDEKSTWRKGVPNSVLMEWSNFEWEQQSVRVCKSPADKGAGVVLVSRDTEPVVFTKEIPYTVTELAKLQENCSRQPKETETDYVWRVPLNGRDRIRLWEEEAQEYWGPGVFFNNRGWMGALVPDPDSVVLDWRVRPLGEGRPPCPSCLWGKPAHQEYSEGSLSPVDA